MGWVRLGMSKVQIVQTSPMAWPLHLFYGMGAPWDVQGSDCSDFPDGLAAAPVLWDGCALGCPRSRLFRLPRWPGRCTCSMGWVRLGMSKVQIVQTSPMAWPL